MLGTLVSFHPRVPIQTYDSIYLQRQSCQVELFAEYSILHAGIWCASVHTADEPGLNMQWLIGRIKSQSHAKRLRQRISRIAPTPTYHKGGACENTMARNLRRFHAHQLKDAGRRYYDKSLFAQKLVLEKELGNIRRTFFLCFVKPFICPHGVEELCRRRGLRCDYPEIRTRLLHLKPHAHYGRPVL